MNEQREFLFGMANLSDGKLFMNILDILNHHKHQILLLKKEDEMMGGHQIQ
jgi:hypothetical protein